jgi:2-amino-4-hydroxy-6-hydroxymethyldihydropteridine diphosphokinase
MIPVFIGIGSNLANPQQQVLSAISQLKSLPYCQFIRQSSLYRSQPMGPQDQPDYVNAVVQLETILEAEALLDLLQKIELDAGRERNKEERWGARTLDLDMLLFGNEIIATERLTVPHYGLTEREFVVIPLAEIAPELQLPQGDYIAELAQNFAHNTLVKLS